MMGDTEINAKYLERAARSYRTSVASAMLVALAEGYANGFRFGW